LNRNKDPNFGLKCDDFPVLEADTTAAERGVFVRALHSPSTAVFSVSAAVDGSLAASLPARNGVAVFAFV
jgi:hypothetical protein